jgi:hypothetical protein
MLIGRGLAYEGPGDRRAADGFGLGGDQIRGLNKRFERRCFHRGIRSHVHLLAKFPAIWRQVA